MRCPWIRLTSRGWKILTAIACLTTFSILIPDPLTITLSMFLGSLLSASLIDLLIKIKKIKEARIEPPSFNLKLRAGEKREHTLRVFTDVPIVLEVKCRWLRFDQKLVNPRLAR